MKPQKNVSAKKVKVASPEPSSLTEQPITEATEQKDDSASSQPIIEATEQKDDSASSQPITEATEQKDGFEGEQPITEATEQKDSPEQPTASASEQEIQPEEPGALFQAVGVLTGKVNFIKEGESERSTIIIDNKEYPLFYTPSKKRAYEALKKEIEVTGESTQRLVVYPKFTHFPGRDQPPNVGFQVVGFDKGRQSDVISEQLQDMEFKLCGLWQFIPVCRTPCISVFKNFTKERLDHIKQSEPAKKVKFMKASHLPLFWRDALVPPFRFNPKAPKEEQGKPVFVQIKAKFVPHRDAFEFDSLLELPLEKPPRFLKASKDDKSTAMAEKKAALKAAGKDFGVPRGKPPFKGKPKGTPKEMPMPKPSPKPKPQQ